MKKTAAKAPVTTIVYQALLAEVKERIRQAQNRAAAAVNSELVAMYWDIGRILVYRQQEEGWGAGVLKRLSNDLKNEFSDQQGFSERNLKLMTQFHREYPTLFGIGQQAVAQLATSAKGAKSGKADAPVKGQQPVADIAALAPRLSWTVNVLLLQRVKDLAIRKWYMFACIEQGWGRDVLAMMIQSQAHKRQGASVNNFEFRERELEAALVAHLERFLLELGGGLRLRGPSGASRRGGGGFLH